MQPVHDHGYKPCLGAFHACIPSIENSITDDARFSFITQQTRIAKACMRSVAFGFVCNGYDPPCTMDFDKMP